MKVPNCLTKLNQSGSPSESLLQSFCKPSQCQTCSKLSCLCRKTRYIRRCKTKSILVYNSILILSEKLVTHVLHQLQTVTNVRYMRLYSTIRSNKKSAKHVRHRSNKVWQNATRLLEDRNCLPVVVDRLFSLLADVVGISNGKQGEGFTFFASKKASAKRPHTSGETTKKMKFRFFWRALNMNIRS